MRCFGNNKPKRSCSDRIRDLKAKSMYKTNVDDFQRRNTRHNKLCLNYNGNIGFYANGLMRNTRSYNNKNLLQRGFALCVDGAYSKNCNNQVNLEKDHKIGQGLQRGLFACPTNTAIGAKSVKVSMGPDSIYNIFMGTSLNSVIDCNPLSGLKVIENWPSSFNAKLGSTPPPWDNVFGYTPIEDWKGGNDPTPEYNNSKLQGNWTQYPLSNLSDIGGSCGCSKLYPLSSTTIDPDNNLFFLDKLS